VRRQRRGVLNPAWLIDTPGLRSPAGAAERRGSVLRVVPRRHMVVADSRQFPWIAEEFAAVMESSTERLIRYFAHLNTMGALIAATRC
jgi:hypothetical protein